MFPSISVYDWEGPALALGPLFLPKVATTLTNLLLYSILLFALPVFFFFFSCLATFGVWPLTFPARARDPWTFPPRSRRQTKTVSPSFSPVEDSSCSSSSKGLPLTYKTCSSHGTSSRSWMNSWGHINQSKTLVKVFNTSSHGTRLLDNLQLTFKV